LFSSDCRPWGPVFLKEAIDALKKTQMNLLKLIFLFLLLLLVQVFILNHIHFRGYINPQIYILFILILPARIPGYALLLTAFFTGLVMDLFTDSLAIHTASTLFAAFCRPAVLRLVTAGSKQDSETDPSFGSIGGLSLSIYSGIIIILHHSMLFFLEIFRFTEIAQTLSRIFQSAIITFIFVIIGFALLEKRAGSQSR